MSVSRLVKPSVAYGERLRMTREICEFLERGGLLPDRYELIDGEIVSKMGQKNKHSLATARVFRLLDALYPADIVRNQSTLQLPNDESNEPEPDVVVLKVAVTEDRYLTAADVCHVVEVSGTTEGRDYGSKYGLYSRAGIGEYWILDLNRRVLNVYRKPNVGEGRYEETVTLGESEMVSPENRPEARIRVGDLLPVE